jgi:hypothetical protein
VAVAVCEEPYVNENRCDINDDGLRGRLAWLGGSRRHAVSPWVFWVLDQ